jgi:NitT/TauT family transport system substrate-binding protein
MGQEAVGGLMLLAEQRHYYANENLAVTVSHYPSGKLALAALLRGEVDVATAAQTPIVVESFSRPDLRIVAVVGSSDNEMNLVIRRDMGVNGAADLRGKRIATQSTSSMHFFLHLYLLKHGLTWKDVAMTFKPPDELPGMLERGEVQAVSMREPLTSQVLSRLGSKVMVLDDPGLYVKFYCLVTTERVMREKPKAVERVIRALLAADRLAMADPEAVRADLARTLEIPAVSSRRLWPYVDLRVCLPQALLLSLEDEARWAMREQLVPAKAMPNYLDLLDMAPLMALRPEVVTVIQ